MVSGKAVGAGQPPPTLAASTGPNCPSLTFRQGLEETSKEALKALRCCVVRMVRGRLGLRGSFPSSPLPLLWLPCPLAGFMSPSSSSLFTVRDTIQPVSLVPLGDLFPDGTPSPPAHPCHGWPLAPWRPQARMPTSEKTRCRFTIPVAAGPQGPESLLPRSFQGLKLTGKDHTPDVLTREYSCL